MSTEWSLFASVYYYTNQYNNTLRLYLTKLNKHFSIEWLTLYSPLLDARALMLKLTVIYINRLNGKVKNKESRLKENINK